jgi:hypothetical protein
MLRAGAVMRAYHQYSHLLLGEESAKEFGECETHRVLLLSDLFKSSKLFLID